jgi:tetratricopeptide (TPR) repeat protein
MATNKKSTLKKRQYPSSVLMSDVSNQKSIYHICSGTYFHYGLLILSGFLLFGYTVNFDYGLDDEFILSSINQTGSDFNGLVSIFKSWFASADYRPVTLASFWLERFFFKEMNPSVSHFLNVMIFVFLLTRIYKFIVISRMIGDVNRLKIVALLTAVFFLVHPNHVSVVANIKSRDNLLSMTFGLMAAIQLITAFDRIQYQRIFVALLLIVLGLLSKRDSFVFLIVPVLVLFFFRNQGVKKLLIISLLSFFLLIVSAYVVNDLTSNLDANLNRSFWGLDENPLYQNDTFYNRISLALTSLFYYIKFLFIPFGYYFYFGYNQIPLTSVFSPMNITGMAIVLVLFIFSIRFYKKNKVYLFSMLFFFLSIAYALNFISPVAGIVMDRYNFIASMGYCMALSAIITDMQQLDYWRRLVKPVLIVLLVTYAGCTIYRTTAWKDRYTLFDRDLKHLTRSVNANRIAAGTYIHFALQEEMKSSYDRSLTDSFINKGERYALLAVKANPASAQSWEHVGLCELYRRNDSTTLEIFRKCYRLDSSYLSGVNYLGLAFWNLDQIDSAAHYFKFVIQREKIFSYSANNLINMYMQRSRHREADSLLQYLERRFPDDVGLKRKQDELKNHPVPFSR